MQNLKLPPDCWMHKNRSAKNQGGLFGGLRGGGSWNRRFVSVDAKTSTVGYGEKKGKSDKFIPLQTLTHAKPVSDTKIKNGGGPAALANFGFAMVTEEKEYLWVTESVETRDAWVTYLTAALEIMQGGTAAASGLPTSGQTLARMYEEAENDQLAGTKRSSKNQGNGSAINLDDDDADSVNLDYDEDDEEDVTGQKSQRELHKLVAGEDDGRTGADLDLDALGDDDDDFSDESDDEYGDDDDDDEDEPGTPSAGINKETIYHNFLTRLAQEGTYDHVNHVKFSQYKDKFHKGDSVLFSRTMEKLGKKDNVQGRDIFVTQKHLYICHKGTFGSASVRVIEIDQIVGVIESNVDVNLFAVIIPSYHDVLLRVTPQKSVVGGSEVDVKHQMIAHLFTSQRRAVSDRPFVFRTVTDVRSVIRRSEDDNHLPMDTKGLFQDHLRCAEKKKIYTAFRTMADSTVYYSIKVFRVNMERQQILSSVVVTDSAVCICNDTCEKVRRRIPLTGIRKILYDSDTYGVLLQCQDMDEILSVKSAADFENLRTAIPYVCKESMHYDVKCNASHQLYSVAQLIDRRSLIDKANQNFKNQKDGFRWAAKVSRKIIRNAASGVKVVGGMVVDATGAVVDKAKDGLGTVGGAMADNAVTGGLMSVMGAAGGKLMGQQRLLFEQCMEMEDETKYVRIDSDTSDSLALQDAPTLANWRLGTIYYSSRCHRFNLQSTLDSDKTAEKIVIVCDKGLYFFDDPNAGGKKLANVFRSNKSLHSDESLTFNQILGVIRCEREPNVVAIQAGEGKTTDLMFRIPNLASTDKFVAYLSLRYQTEITAKFDGLRCYIPKYISAKPDSLRQALKRTTIDPDPTIALRSHSSSDQLSLSIIPDICDTMRRHGDNKIFFSGIAWRFRGIKKPGEPIPKPPLATADLKKNKDYKSFLLVVTNCAVYMMTKGGYEITRRTELRCFQKCFLATDDPDAVLLEVPSEYDVFMKIEGRAKELVDRMQDARSHWTEHDLYLSGEEEGSHDIATSTFPVETKPNLHTLGKTEKPKGFDELQGKREAQSIKITYVRLVTRTIEQALATQVDPSIGFGGRYRGDGDGSSGRGSYAPTMMTQYDTWESEIKRNEDRIKTILFAVKRAYRFGFRPHVVKNMTQALGEVEEFNRRKEYAEQLTQALAKENIMEYDLIWNRCKHLKGMELLQRRQREQLNKLRARQAIEAKIVRSIMSSDEDFAEETKIFGSPNKHGTSAFDEHNDDDDSVNLDYDADEGKRPSNRASPAPQDVFSALTMTLEDRLPKIEELFVEAHHSGVKAERLQEFRGMLNRRLQQERMEEYLRDLSRANSNQLNPQQKALLRQTAEELDVPIEGYAILKDDGDPMLSWARRILEAAADSGNAKTMSDALARVEDRSIDQDPEVKPLMNQVRHELQVISDSDDIIETLTTLTAQLKAGSSRMSSEELLEYRVQLQGLADQTKDSRGLKPRHALANMYVRRVTDAIELRERERARAEREKKAREEYVHRMEQADLDQKKAQEDLQRQEVAELRRRREEQLLLWESKSTRHRVLLDQYLRTGDVQSSRLSAQSCKNLAMELRGMFNNFSESDKREWGAKVATIEVNLLETTKRAQQFIQTKTGSTLTGNTQGAGSPGPAEAESGVPLSDDAREDIRNLNKVKLMAWVQAHQGQLSMKNIEEIRNLWRDASAEGKWKQTLHSNIHTAVALGSVDMLECALDQAKHHGGSERGYSDSVVRDGRHLLERMKETAAKKAKENVDDGAAAATNGTSTGDAEGAKKTHGLPTVPRPVPPPAPQIADPGRYESVKTLHSAICAMFVDQAGECGKKDPRKLRLAEDSMTIRHVLDAWIKTLTHRAKPTGMFKKTDRNLKDVIQVLSNSFHHGVALAPETNKLYNSFERVKKFNNPKGLNSHQMFMRYVLHKNRLSAMVQEMNNMSQHDLENVFFEDSIHRHADVCNLQLQKLSEGMNTWMEWNFDISEGDNPDDPSQSPFGSPGGTPNESLAGSPGGSSPNLGLSGPPIFHSNGGDDNPIPILRKSVAALTDYFRRESSKATGFSPKELKLIFDESHNKAVGLLVRESLCVALNHIFLSGFKGGGAIFKKHPWDFMVYSGEKLKVGARGLGGVGVPDALEMVTSLTSTESVRRGRGVDLSKMSKEKLNDLRMRMFMCHCLNQQTLQRSMEAIFDDQNSGADPLMQKYYQVEKCAMMDPAKRKEISRVLAKLSSLPFTLSVDAEIW